MAKKRGWNLMADGPDNFKPKISRRKIHGIQKNFFLGDKLYTYISVKKHFDQLECWEHATASFVYLSYTYVLHNQEDFWQSREVANMMRRRPKTIANSMNTGKIRKPTKYVPIGQPLENAKWYAWNKEDVFDAWEYFANTNWQNTGSPVPTPSRAELRALMENEATVYIKDDDGTFIPTWRS